MTASLRRSVGSLSPRPPGAETKEWDALGQYFAETQSFPLLTPEEELHWARSLAESRQRLVSLVFGTPHGRRRALELLARLHGGKARMERTLDLDLSSAGERDRVRRRLAHDLELLGSPEDDDADEPISASQVIDRLASYEFKMRFVEEWQAEIIEHRGPTCETTAELRDVCRRYRESRERLVVSNLRLVVSMAKKATGWKIPLVDLIQEGNLGLLRACEKFDPEKGFRFTTYAAWWIRQSIQRAVENQSNVVRIPVRKFSLSAKLRRSREEHFKETGKTVDAETLAEHHDLSPTEVRSILQASRPVCSTHIPVGDGSTRLEDYLEDESTEDPLESACRSHVHDRIRSLLSVLNEREQSVIRSRFGLGADRSSTLEALARRMQVSGERVRQIQMRALEKLKAACRAEKIERFLSA